MLEQEIHTRNVQLINLQHLCDAIMSMWIRINVSSTLEKVAGECMLHYTQLEVHNVLKNKTKCNAGLQ